MSQIKVTEITARDTGTSNIQLNSDGDTTLLRQNTGQLAGLRNQIINGNMQIWQRGTTFTDIGAGQYIADRWFVLGSDADFERKTWSNGKPYLWMSAPTSGTSITQRIEIENLYGFEGKEMTLSAKVQTDKPDDVKFIDITYRQTNGDYISMVQAESAATGLTAGVWGNISITFTLPPIPADTGCLQLGVMSGADNQTIEVFDVQLEVGPVATPFEQRFIGLELSLCQRYFVRTPSNYVIWTGAVDTGVTYSVSIPYPVPMRVTPTVNNVTSAGGSLFGAPSVNTSSSYSTILKASATNTGNNAYYFAGFDADAEL